MTKVIFAASETFGIYPQFRSLKMTTTPSKGQLNHWQLDIACHLIDG